MQQLFVKVHILNMGVIDITSAGQLIFTIFERDMIVTRTQEGKLYAKTHDPPLSRETPPNVY